MNDQISTERSSENNTAAAVDPLIGCSLANRFLVEAKIGAGGMSVVYKGTHTALARAVAIKTLKVDLCSHPVIVSRFEREMKSLSILNHPNIITIYDCVVSPQGQPYIIMDYVQGESLETLLESGPINVARTVELAVEICNALEHAHRHGVIHRDLKPANIMLNGADPNTATVKIVDFGLAKLAEDTQKLTQADELWGSLPYMSPEQCSSNAQVEIDERSDIYSLGAVIFQMLTGKDPFYGLDLVSTIQHHLNVPPPSFAQVAPTLTFPPELEKVIDKALSKKTTDRFQSMKEFRDAILFATKNVAPNAGSKKSSTTQNRQPTPASTGSKAIQRNGVTQEKLRQNQPNKSKIAIACATLFCTAALAYCLLAVSRSGFNEMRTSAPAALSTATIQPAVTPPPPAQTKIQPVSAAKITNPSSEKTAHKADQVHALVNANHAPRSLVEHLQHTSTEHASHTASGRPSHTGAERSPRTTPTHSISKHLIIKPSSSSANPTAPTKGSNPWDSLNAERSK